MRKIMRYSNIVYSLKHTQRIMVSNRFVKYSDNHVNYADITYI